MKSARDGGIDITMSDSMSLGFDVTQVILLAFKRYVWKRRRQKHPAPKARLIALPWDYEIIALPLANYLRSLGTTTATSCVWPSRSVVGKAELEIAPIAMSYNDEPLDDQGTELVIINSFVDTTTVIESMVTYAHPMRDMRYKKISVFAPIASAGSSQVFRRVLRESEKDAFSWTSAHEVDPEIRPQVQAKLDEWRVSALGLDAPEELQTHFPKTVLGYLNEQPRPPQNEFSP